jgi:hypothetical protein
VEAAVQAEPQLAQHRGDQAAVEQVPQLLETLRQIKETVVILRAQQILAEAEAEMQPVEMQAEKQAVPE